MRFDANVPANASTTCLGSMEDQSFAFDEKKALSTNGYSLPGYDFGGWNTKADGTGTSYADGSEVQGLSGTGGTITLYAQWSAKAYAITFNPGEIGGDEHVQTAYFDQPGTLETYSDAAFGWNSGDKTLHGWAGAGFGSFYADGADFVNLCGAPDANGNPADAALTAQWVQGGQIIVTVTKDGVPQEDLADDLSLVDESGTEFSVPISYENGEVHLRPVAASQPGGTRAQLPPGTYDLSFEASGYPQATSRIVYGDETAAAVVFEYYTVSLAKDAAYPDANEIEISGGAPIAGESDKVVVLDGGSVHIETTVAENYQFDGYTAVGVTPNWQDGDPSKAEQDIEVYGTVDISAHVLPNELSVIVVAGMVVWDDDDDYVGARPESVTIRLLVDGEESNLAPIEVTEDNGWRYSFGEFPQYVDGAKVEYGVAEEPHRGLRHHDRGLLCHQHLCAGSERPRGRGGLC